MNLQKNVSLGKQKYPTKTTMNMVMREDKGMSTPKLVAWIIVIVVIVFCAAKFGAIDQINRVSQAEANYNAKVQENESYLALIADYDDVLKEYRLYSTDWMSEYNTDATVNRKDVLDMVDTYISPNGTVKSLTVTGNIAQVEMGGMSLSKISAMFKNIEKSPIVANVKLNTAKADISSDEDSVFDFTITLQEAATQDEETQEVES